MSERRRVKILSANVARKIAAGEVIDRPNAIVRELMDNSIDSGAKKISVEIQSGGIEKIRVVDNGCGMTEDVSSRNLRAVRKKLTEMSIPVLSCEVGDNFPRTVIFEPESGVMNIKTVGIKYRFI